MKLLNKIFLTILMVTVVLFMFVSCSKDDVTANSETIYYYGDNPDPIVVGTYKLNEVPKDVYISDDILFIYDDGRVQSVRIENKKLIYNDLFDDVSMISENQYGYFLLKKQQEFVFVSDEESKISTLFANAVNNKLQESDIVQIVSNGGYDPFTAVLFEDGTVLSDLNYFRVDTESVEEFDFLILENVKSDMIFAEGCYVLAVDKSNHSALHYYYSVPGSDDLSGKQGFTILDYPVVSFSVSPFENAVLCGDGNIYWFNVDEAYYAEVFEPKELYCNHTEEFVKLEDGWDNVALALTKSNKLYHFGRSYLVSNIINERQFVVGFANVFADPVYESSDIKHFFPSDYGIVVILNDGTMEIIKN